MEIYRNSAQDIPGAPSTWHICDVSCWRGLAASPFWLRMKTTARKTGLLTQIFYPQIRWKIPLINSWKLCVYIYISCIHHIHHTFIIHSSYATFDSNFLGVSNTHIAPSRDGRIPSGWQLLASSKHAQLLPFFSASRGWKPDPVIIGDSST